MPKKTKKEKIAAKTHISNSVRSTSSQRPDVLIQNFDHAGENNNITNVNTLASVATLSKPRSAKHSKFLQINEHGTTQFKRDMSKSLLITGLLMSIECVLYVGQNQYHAILSKLLSVIHF